MLALISAFAIALMQTPAAIDTPSAQVNAVQTMPPPPPGFVLDTPGPWAADPVATPSLPPPRFGPGPHTLVISSMNGQTVTRIDYKTGGACKHAREEVLRQVATPISKSQVSSPVAVFCVPR